MRLKALVSKDDEIKWLVIESDEDDTNGYFIYYHLDDNNAWDSWHRTLEEALESAHLQYAIMKESWEALNDT